MVWLPFPVMGGWHCFTHITLDEQLDSEISAGFGRYTVTPNIAPKLKQQTIANCDMRQSSQSQFQIRITSLSPVPPGKWDNSRLSFVRIHIMSYGGVLPKIGLFGGFRKWGYPQIIQSIFGCSILEYSHLLIIYINLPYLLMVITFVIHAYYCY